MCALNNLVTMSSKNQNFEIRSTFVFLNLLVLINMIHLKRMHLYRVFDKTFHETIGEIGYKMMRIQ